MLDRSPNLYKLLGIIIAICIGALHPANASASTPVRKALIIANSGYTNTIKLKNPARDTDLIARNLKDLGFDVAMAQDLDAIQIANLISSFSAEIDSDTEVLFYYAGHGLQFRGENYMVGISAKLEGEAMLQFEAYSLNSVINVLEQKASTLLLFWDACRDNPLAAGLLRSIASSGASKVPVRSGAAAIAPRRGDTLAVFAAEPGKTASDGIGQNSPFAWALSRHISSPDLEVEVMLKRVSQDVLRETEYKQRPERLSQLTREFYFKRSNTAVASYEREVQELRERLAEIDRNQGSKKRIRVVGLEEVRHIAPPAARSIDGGSVEAKDDSGNPNDTHASEDIVVAVDNIASALVRELKVSPDGKLLAIGDDNGFLRLVHLDTYEVQFSRLAHQGRITSIDFSADSSVVITSGRDGSIRFWNASEGQEKRAALSETGLVPISVGINPNPSTADKFLLVGDTTGRLVAWDLKRQKVITNQRFHQGAVYAVSYRPSGGGEYASAGADGLVKVRYPNGTRVSFKAHNGSIFSASYSNSGRFLITTGKDRSVKLWRTDRLKRNPSPMLFQAHLKYALTGDISKDDQIVASAGGDKSINLWAAQEGKLIGTLNGHTSDVESLVFTPDGKMVVSASEDRTVRIWSVDNKEELARLVFTIDGSKYAGVVAGGRIFGDRATGLLKVFENGREIPADEAEGYLTYIGRGIQIQFE